MGILRTAMVGLTLVPVLCSLISATMSLPYPSPGEGGYPGTEPGGYFQYVNVPAHKEYEFGWNRGNPAHYSSRYEQSKDHRFRTRVRWGDEYGGYGEHYYEYNHGPQYEEQQSYEAPVKQYIVHSLTMYNPLISSSFKLK